MMLPTYLNTHKLDLKNFQKCSLIMSLRRAPSVEKIGKILQNSSHVDEFKFDSIRNSALIMLHGCLKYFFISTISSD